MLESARAAVGVAEAVVLVHAVEAAKAEPPRADAVGVERARCLQLGCCP